MEQPCWRTVKNNYLKVKLSGKVKHTCSRSKGICGSGEQQMQELILSRGYQSSVEPVLLFGLGNTTGKTAQGYMPTWEVSLKTNVERTTN
jgi:hypothetical protein